MTTTDLLNQVHEYIPQALRDKPLYQRLAVLSAWVMGSRDVHNIEAIEKFYDPEETPDVLKLERLLGASEYMEVLDPLIPSLAEHRAFVGLLRGIYQLKGTKQAVELALRALGMETAGVYDWDYVNTHKAEFGLPAVANDPILDEYRHYLCQCGLTIGPDGYDGCVAECTYVITFPEISIIRVGLTRTYSWWTVNSTFDDDLNRFLELFVHACSRLEFIVWALVINDTLSANYSLGSIELTSAELMPFFRPKGVGAKIGDDGVTLQAGTAGPIQDAPYLQLGTGGHEIGDVNLPIEPANNRTAMDVPVATKYVPTITITGGSLVTDFKLALAVANGDSPYTEIGLFSQGNRLIAYETFPALYKTDRKVIDVKITLVSV